MQTLQAKGVGPSMRANWLSVAACATALGWLASQLNLAAGIGPRFLGFPGDVVFFPLWLGFTIAAFLRHGRKALWTLVVTVPVLAVTVLFGYVVIQCAWQGLCL